MLVLQAFCPTDPLVRFGVADGYAFGDGFGNGYGRSAAREDKAVHHEYSHSVEYVVRGGLPNYNTDRFSTAIT